MNREFKGIWIPKEVWLDERLTALDKVIFAEIDSLDTEEAGCYAGNDYLAKFCQCSESKVSKTIRKLIDLKYIKFESFNGRRRVLRVVNNTKQTSKKYYADKEKVRGFYNKNNIKNNINNIRTESSYSLEDFEAANKKKPEYKRKQK